MSFALKLHVSYTGTSPTPRHMGFAPNLHHVRDTCTKPSPNCQPHMSFALKLHHVSYTGTSPIPRHMGFASNLHHVRYTCTRPSPNIPCNTWALYQTDTMSVILAPSLHQIYPMKHELCSQPTPSQLRLHKTDFMSVGLAMDIFTWN